MHQYFRYLETIQDFTGDRGRVIHQDCISSALITLYWRDLQVGNGGGRYGDLERTPGMS